MITRSAARFSRPAFIRTARSLARPAAVSRPSRAVTATAFLSDTLDSLAGASLDNGPFDPMIDPCWDFGDDGGPCEDPDIGAAIGSAVFDPTEPNHLFPNL
jgi:hypothetical protein